MLNAKLIQLRKINLTQHTVIDKVKQILIQSKQQNYSMNPQQSTRLCEIKYKIVFMGQMCTGKTSIIDRFTKNRFDDKMKDTVGIDLISRNISYKNNTYKLQLWDTAGQQRYRSLVPNYIRDAHCAVFVYDITNEVTFQNLIHWMELFKNYQPNDAISILVGNKNDKKQDRQVSQQKAYQWAKKYSMAYTQVSALNGCGIQDIFHSIIQNINISHQVFTSEKQILSQMKTADSDAKSSQRSIRKGERPSGMTTTSSNRQFESSKINKLAVLKLKQRKRQFGCCYI